MAETVLSFALDQLSILVREEARLLGGLRQEVELIRIELGHMRAFLSVAETKEDDEPQLKEWIKQVREAAYDAEDVLDEFVARFSPHRRSKGFIYGSIKRIFNSIKTLRARHRVAIEIQSIKARIERISDAHLRYQSEYGSSSFDAASRNKNSWRYSRDDALLVDEAELVGINQPKQQLISQLLEDDSKFKVISVVGMGGLGKTTLVKKVHEDANVRRYFPIRAWVTVSQTVDFRELLKNLIQNLHAEIQRPVPQLIESMADLELKVFVKDFLQQGRYAIVFDDVWDVEFWNAIKSAFPENGYNNRVMLTTRIKDVAFASCRGSSDYIHKMEPLSYGESWTLFCNRTFKDNCCPDHLKNVAQVILGKCEGLPLAILAISGVLASKDTSWIDEWKRVRLSLGRELEGTGKLDRVNKILCLSYNDLPSHLKTCLLYLSIYPEDFEINCETLVQLWIAERFVEWREGMTMEDTAWDYLRQLADRSLIQVTMMLYEGRPFSCRIHDLLREVILSKSREQNMVTVTTAQHMRWPEKVRRLVINNFLTDSYQESNWFGHLRSLIVFESMTTWSITLLPGLLTSKLLKVLNLRGMELEEIPNEIFNLFHLKHLDLMSTRVKTVPKSIGKLQNLEYLNMSETEVRELPMEILKLQKIRCLFVGQVLLSKDGIRINTGFKAPPQMEGLLALQTLNTIDAATSGIIKEIGKLTQLRLLGITNLKREDGKELWSSLENLNNLKELVVASIGKDEVIDLNYFLSSSSSHLQSLCMLRLAGRLEKMPQWITCIHSLVRIDLESSGLREDILVYLQHLPNLVTLSLILAYQGEGLCFKAGGFLKLEEIDLIDMEGLSWIRVEQGAMPHLRKLLLGKLPLLKKLPMGIQHLTQLQKLYLSEMDDGLIKNLAELNEENEDYRSILHIPQINFSTWTGDRWVTRQLWGMKKA